MLHEVLMYVGYASILLSVTLSLVECFEGTVTALHPVKGVTLNQIGQRNFAYGVTVCSDVTLLEK